MSIAPYAWFPVAAADGSLLLADIAVLCAQPLEASRIRVRMRPLPFYELFDLYELTEVSDSEPMAAGRRRAYVLWTPGLLRVLNLTNKPIYDLNDELAKLNALHLTEATTPDYLRFFWGMVKGNQGFFQILENTEILVRAESGPASPPAEATNDHDPAAPLESWYSAPAMQVEPLAAGSFQAALAISFQTNLFKAQSQVTANGLVSLKEEQVVGEILTPVPPPDEQQPHEVLALALTAEAQQQQPANLAKRLRPYQTTLLEQVRAIQATETTGFEWHYTAPTTHAALIAAINAACQESLHPALTLSRATSLPFYELVDLYELEFFGLETGVGPMPRLRTYVLWTQPAYLPEGANLLLPLNWTNGPLYELAEELERFGQLKLNAATAPAYLRFFFNLVKGRHGFFRILDAGTVEVRPENRPDYAEVIGPLVAQTPFAASKIAPTEFRVILHIEFKNSLFRTDSYVTTTGQVRLADEALLGDLLTPIAPLAEHLAALPPLLWALHLREAQPTERQRTVFQLGLRKLQEVAENAPKEQGWEILSADEFLTQLKGMSRSGGVLRRKRVLDKRTLSNLVITAAGIQGLPSHEPPADNNTLAGNTQELTGTDKIVITDADCPHGKIRLEDCYFEGSLEIDVTHPHALFEASRCFFKGDIIFGKGWTGSVTLKTSRFLVATESGAPQLKMTGIEQAGSVELDAVWMASGLTFDRLHCSLVTISNSLLEGNIALTRLRCEAIAIEKGTTLTGQLNLSQLNCGTVKLTMGPRSEAEIDLTNAVVQGPVELAELTSGKLSGTNLRCETLTVTGLGPDGQSTLKHISLPELRATRVLISAIRCEGACMLDTATIEFNLSIFDSHIADKLSLVNATLRNLIFTKLHVGQQCDLTSTVIERKLKLISWFGYDGDSGVFIGGNLLLDRMQAGHLDISDCTIGGNVSAADAQFASFNWWPGLERVPGEKVALRFKRSQVRGYVHLPGTIVAGDFNWVGVSVGGDNDINKADPAEKVAFEAGMLQVQGHFRLTSTVEELRKNVLDLYTGYTGIDEDKLGQQVQDVAAAMPHSEWQNWSTFAGTVSLKGLALTGDADCSQSSVGGSLVLDFSQLGGSLSLNGTRVAGSLRLNRCRVQHNLELGQKTRIAKNGIMTALRVEGSLRFADARFDHSLYLNDARLTQGLTTTEGLTVGGCLLLNAAQAQENVDLTGLILGERPCPDCQPAPYQFSATDLVVEGTLLFSPELATVNDSQHARIPGDINLSRAKLRRLVLFDEERFASSKQAALAKSFAAIDEKLNLEDAEIGTLRVHQPPPRQLILRGLSVREWDFEKLTEQARDCITPGCELDLRLRKLEDDGVAEKARGYIIFLERAKAIPASLYRAVERRFYDEGDTETSDAVYKSLRDREIREIQSGLVRGAARFFNGFFGYFVTWPARWAWVIIGGLFAVSSLIFSRAAWIIPHTTSALAGKSALPLAVGTSHPTIWDFGNGMLLALRYHIPIIQAVSHPEWVPSDQPWQFIGPNRYWLSPESYAAIIALISWIIVPVFILIISRNILRRVKQGS